MLGAKSPVVDTKNIVVVTSCHKQLGTPAVRSPVRLLQKVFRRYACSAAHSLSLTILGRWLLLNPCKRWDSTRALARVALRRPIVIFFYCGFGQQFKSVCARHPGCRRHCEVNVLSIFSLPHAATLSMPDSMVTADSLC